MHPLALKRSIVLLLGRSSALEVLVHQWLGLQAGTQLLV
jgi:hypothetical protein